MAEHGESVPHQDCIRAALRLGSVDPRERTLALRDRLAAAEELLARASERIDLGRNQGGPALRYDIRSFLDAGADDA